MAVEGHPLAELDEADLDFIVRLVLASGSLKDLAAGYGVSYPTIRGRLDRVIARLKVVLEKRPANPMSQLLADLVERGEITISGARAIQELHRTQIERKETKR